MSASCVHLEKGTPAECKTGRDTAAAPFFVSSQQALPSTLLCENGRCKHILVQARFVFLFLRASQMLFQSRSWKYVLLALLAALVPGWQLRKRHRKSLVAPKRTSCSSCGTCHRQVYQLSPLKGGDGRYYCVACWKTFCDELPLCKCIAGNVQWCADCKMPATQINPVFLKDPYDANNDLQYRCKDCWFEVKADQTLFLCSNADMFQ